MERALQHIEEAKAFSDEVGGTDEDIKRYFFALSTEELRNILNTYEKKYSTSARNYAEQALPEWKSGRRKMSGEVAKRLFGLMPERMPIRDKFKLVESLWRHKSPRSFKSLFIGPDADLRDLQHRIESHLRTVITDHTIPVGLEKRFDWLAAGDVHTRQQLLNHMQQMERQLVEGSLTSKIPMVLSRMAANNGARFTETIEIGNHTVSIEFNQGWTGISEARPPYKQDESNSSVGCMVVAGILLLLIVLFGSL